MDRKMVKEGVMAAFEELGGLREIAAQGGSRIIDTTDATAVEAHSIIANNDVVIAACTGKDIDGNAVNFLTAYNWDTMPAGTLMKVPKGYRILSITLTSGSLSVYNY